MTKRREGDRTTPPCYGGPCFPRLYVQYQPLTPPSEAENVALWLVTREKRKKKETVPAWIFICFDKKIRFKLCLLVKKITFTRMIVM